MGQRLVGLLVLALAALFAARWLATREPVERQIELGDRAAPTSEAKSASTELLAVPSAVTERRDVAEPEVAREITAAAAVAPATDIVAVPPPDGSLRLWGTVRTKGLVLESIPVTCRGESGRMRNQIVDVRSRYTFDGLAPGRYWLVAGTEAAGFARASVDLQADMRVDFELEIPRTIVVRILDEVGVAWVPPDAELAVTRRDPGAWMPGLRPRMSQIRQRPYGRVEPDLPPTTLTLDWPPPNFVSLVIYESVVATQPVGPSDVEIVFRVDRADRRIEKGSVRLRIVDGKTREPVEDASVRLFGSGTMSALCPGGSADIPLVPGTWDLLVLSRGSGHAEAHFRIEPATALDLGDVLLGRGATVRGSVVDEAGRGLEARVRCDPCDEHGVLVRETANLRTWTTAADGTFEFSGLTRGFHRLSPSFISERRSTSGGTSEPTDRIVEARGRDDATFVRVVDLREHDVEGVVLESRPGVPLVIRPSGRETSESRFRVLDANGLVVVTQGVARDWPARVLLAPGAYEVELWHERDGPPRRVPIAIVRDAVAVDMP